jgi:uncharacterized protein YodC (DUF2158 family)
MNTSMTQISVGMLVKPHSGAAWMTVHETGTMVSTCYWFNGHVLQKKDFMNHELGMSDTYLQVEGLLAGDKVRLRSGSPDMEIARIEFRKGKPFAICSWEVLNEQHVKHFNALSLEKLKE